MQDIDIIDNNNELSEVDNFKLLNLFLSAKEVEGCSEKTIAYYNSTIEKMLMKIKKLQRLRDTLLPKLMSGEIDVSKINCDLE